eukprot:COSAG01_NODE_58503_length_305_cov_1.606796_1_plen_45_part_10
MDGVHDEVFPYREIKIYFYAYTDTHTYLGVFTSIDPLALLVGALI